MTVYTIFADADDQLLRARDADMANACDGAAASQQQDLGDTGGSASTGTNISTTYRVSQYFARFDASAVPAGSDSGITLNLYLGGSAAQSGESLEVRDSDWSAHDFGDFVSYSDFGSYDLLATLSLGTSAGYRSFDPGWGSVVRGDNKIFVHGTRQRTLSEPTSSSGAGTDTVGISTADASGTSQDPYLEFTGPSSDVVADGALAGLTVTAFEAGAEGGAAVDGAAAGLTLTAFEVLAAGAASVEGALAALMLTAFEAGAEGGAAAEGALAGLTLTAFEGSAGARITADGGFAGLSLAACEGVASGGALASGEFVGLTLTPFVGTTAGGAIVEGALAGLALTPFAGTGFERIFAAGGLAGTTLTAFEGAATGGAAVPGDLAGVSFGAFASAVTTGAIVESGFAGLAITPFAGEGAGGALADGGFPQISVSPFSGSGGLADGLGDRVVRTVWLGFLDFLGDPVRATTWRADVAPSGTGDVDLDGETFDSISHELVSIGDIRQGEGGSETLRVTLSGLIGVDTDLLNTIGDRSNWAGRPARFWELVFNEAGEWDGRIAHAYTGYMTSIRITGDAASQQIVVECENYLAAFSQASNRRYLDQADYDPGDLSAKAALEIANGISGNPLISNTPTSGSGASGGRNDVNIRDVSYL